MAMSSSILFLRSPNPGAFTEAALNVPRSHYEERLVGLHDLIEQRQHVLDVADLLVGNEDVGIIQHSLHALLIGHEIRGEVALVELHPLGELEVHPEGLGLLDVDHTVLADLVNGVGDDVSDLLGTRAYGTNPRDLLFAGDLRGLTLYGLNCLGNRLVDPTAQDDRVRPSSDVLQALADYDLGQNSRRRGAVTGYVVGLGCDLLDELGTLVLEDVLKLYLTGDRHTIVGDGRRAELLV
jgi:hypothetical protein